MRLLTILARFGTEQYASAEGDLDNVFDRQMRSVQRSVIVVDNALPREVVQEQRGRLLLGGDNRVFEFSAFDRALSYIGSDIWS